MLGDFVYYVFFYVLVQENFLVKKKDFYKVVKPQFFFSFFHLPSRSDRQQDPLPATVHFPQVPDTPDRLLRLQDQRFGRCLRQL